MSNALGQVIPVHRWQATIEYRSDNGIIDVVHAFNEIEELHDIIERGPHWDTIIKCTSERFFKSDVVQPLTIEAAEKM